MKAYTIFDDFGPDPSGILEGAGIRLTTHPCGVPRPDNAEMKLLLEKYDCVIIGTSQKISPDMFENVSTHKIIATASVGTDHIVVPDDKKQLVTIINTPRANAQSVAEFTIGCALSCCKRISEGVRLYSEGRNNKSLTRKPEDLYGKTMGVIGAGNVSAKIMEYARFFGMNILCWTPHPEFHLNLSDLGVTFSELPELVRDADVISVNLPKGSGTEKLISPELVEMMKDDAVFISVSRLEVVDFDALINKAKKKSGFYVCLDVDVDAALAGRLDGEPNIFVTPHIAGGTVETRKRMFMETALQIAALKNGGVA